MLITNDKDHTNINGLVSACSTSAVSYVVKISQHSQRTDRKWRPFGLQNCRPAVILRVKTFLANARTLELRVRLKQEKDKLEISLFVLITKHTHIYCN
jgi:hypothetical protein